MKRPICLTQIHDRPNGKEEKHGSVINEKKNIYKFYVCRSYFPFDSSYFSVRHRTSFKFSKCKLRPIEEERKAKSKKQKQKKKNNKNNETHLARISVTYSDRRRHIYRPATYMNICSYIWSDIFICGRQTEWRHRLSHTHNELTLIKYDFPVK